MNKRSLRFQLFTWYVALLLGTFTIIGLATYAALQRSLTHALEQSQLRRSRQIGHLLQAQLQNQALGFPDRLREEIEESFSPSQNNRFIRITRRDGMELYRSQTPQDGNFDPSFISPPQWGSEPTTIRSVAAKHGEAMVLTSQEIRAPNGTLYMVESGAPLTEVRSDLRKWLVFLGVVFPILVVIALGGGYLLVNRALSPVDHIAAKAERISFHNLDERLPVARTGDELERLSTALNHMIERLDASFQHSRRFVADASHELRTPLTVLRGELEGVVKGPRMPADWRDRLGSALEEVDRLIEIVEGLFAISRLDAGEAAVEWTKCNLAHLAASTADQMSLLAEDKNIRVSYIGSQDVWVEGDRARLKQVVVNLLDNAIKYTLEGGLITLSVSTQDDKALLEVADNGIGIPQEAQPRVFERFFRVDLARSRELGGAGLGLSIVRSICAAHQGRVEVTSKPGQGSRFQVELPVASRPAAVNQSQHMIYAR